MADLEELELVRKAILEAAQTRGCCEWQEKAKSRVGRDGELKRLTPEEIRLVLIDFVTRGGEIHQQRETRPEYNDRTYYYKAVVPTSGFPRGLFVEFVLVEVDPELPGVELVNAHEQKL